ncbi:MAG: hypothetical protein AB7G28_16395 [Pirellulales bacterium]
MHSRTRAVLAALLLASAAGFVGSTAAGKPPEWQEDLDYLTWDRRAENGAAAAGEPVYLQREKGQASAISSAAPAPTWQLRVRDFYSLVTPRGWRTLVSRDEPAVGTTATLTVPAPGQAVEQPVGPVAQRDTKRGTIVR